MALTIEQQAVVDNHGGNLLVSAAAGAGKTKVLVERIMKKLASGADITNFLVITYTRAAAAELRVKIKAAISEKLRENPNDTHLQKQAVKVGSAQISTVHSFCSSLLKEYSIEADVPSDFILLEEQETNVLKLSAMEDAIELAYKKIESSPNLAAFINELAYGRDDSAIPAIILGVYDTIQSHPWPQEWEKQCIENMDVGRYSDAAETVWGRYIMDDIIHSLAAQKDIAENIRSLCEKDALLATAYAPTISTDIAKMEDAMRAKTWDEMFIAMTRQWNRFKPVRKSKDADIDVDLQDTVKRARDKYKALFDAKAKSLTGTSSEVLDDLRKTVPPIKGMFEMTSLFEKIYREKKNARNALDFSDLEHMSIQLLVDAKTKKPTRTAEEVNQKYMEIMIDEYQDTNAVQETIFDAVSTGYNKFMVGDIKQSIYAFRLADPTIFLRHYRDYADYKTAEPSEPRKIILSKNFRSRPEILDATNAIMKTCMSEEVGGMEYGEAEMLSSGREDFKAIASPAVELVAIDLERESEVPSEVDDEIESIVKSDAEAMYVASRISRMLEAGELIQDDETGERRPVKASDIAILLRSTKNSAKHFVKALQERGISSVCSRNISIMDTTEVASLYSYLQIIDNPMDIPLVGVMASPLEGFTAKELVEIRVAGKAEKTYLGAVRAAAKKNWKAAQFIERFDELRELSRRSKISELLARIIELTNAADVFGAMQGGMLRNANIRKFEQMVVNYENGGTRGLFEFICYIEALKSQGAELPQASIAVNDSAVTILSVHASKGLEYPVVFLADMSRKFNMNDLKDTAMLHKDLGAGVQVLDRELMNRYPTIARNAIAARKAAENKSEEMRILYVALTRAKQKLVMTYAAKLSKRFMALSEAAAGGIVTPQDSQSAVCPGDWAIMTQMANGNGDFFNNSWAGCPWKTDVVKIGEIIAKTATLSELEAAMEDAEKEIDGEVVHEDLYPSIDAVDVEESIKFSYKFATSVHVPAKAVATDFYEKNENISIRRPDFAQKEGFTAAEKGSFTHVFMQYANYQKCAGGNVHEIDMELARMVERGWLTEDQKGAVLKSAITKFFKSKVGKELSSLCPESIHREYPFSLLLPANELFAEEGTPIDKVLLEGIVDLFVEEADGLSIYDFKTDVVDDDTILERAKKYEPQISMYGKALSVIYNKPVKKKSIIFLRTAKEIAV